MHGSSDHLLEVVQEQQEMLVAQEHFQLVAQRLLCRLFDFERLGNGGYNQRGITDGSQVHKKHATSEAVTQFRCDLQSQARFSRAPRPCQGQQPDIFTLAKALGAGFPIGAMLAKERVAAAFGPGDHGSTFGGNPLACAVGNASVNLILGDKLHEAAAEKGAYFLDKLAKLKDACGAIGSVRGRGLMLAVELNAPDAVKVKNAMFDAGCLVGSVGDNILRWLPPLTVTYDEIDEAASILKGVLA